MALPPPDEPAGFAEPYSRYAEVYDRIGQRAFGERIAEATLDYFRSAGVAPRSVIDLACGTGAATRIFASAGLVVTGIDRSPHMATVASMTLSGTGATVIIDDMRSFMVPERVDLVTCFYDAMNYLLEVAEVRQVFERVFDALRPGGYFVFDLNTRTKFAHAWQDVCYVAFDSPDLFGVYQSWFEPDTGRSPLVLTFFHRKPGDERWHRFDEEHIERAYPLETIVHLLKETGFVVIDLRDYADRSARFGAAGSESSDRVVFIARRMTGEDRR